MTLADLDVKPANDQDPVNTGSRGVVPMALLSSAVFDATTLDATSLKVGPGGAVPQRARRVDVDGDARAALRLHVSTLAMGLPADTDRLCLAGTMGDGRDFEACDATRAVP